MFFLGGMKIVEVKKGLTWDNQLLLILVLDFLDFGVHVSSWKCYI